MALDVAVMKFRRAARASNTRRTYASGWEDWRGWFVTRYGREMVASEVAPDEVCEYLAHLAVERGMAAQSIRARLCALRAYFRRERLGASDPTRSDAVQETMQGIRRELGMAPRNRKDPVRLRDLKRMVRRTPLKNWRGYRDRALLLLMYATGCRRGEVASMTRADVEFEDAAEPGYVDVTIRRSKGDQLGYGRTVRMVRRRSASVCPVRVLRAWLEYLPDAPGAALFPGRVMGRTTGLTGRGVAAVVKEAAERVKIPAERVGGHSLRSGSATDQLQATGDVLAVAGRLGHRSIQTTARYNRRGLGEQAIRD
jgi:site-specific recombinase XerD